MTRSSIAWIAIMSMIILLPVVVLVTHNKRYHVYCKDRRDYFVTDVYTTRGGLLVWTTKDGRETIVSNAQCTFVPLDR